MIHLFIGSRVIFDIIARTIRFIHHLQLLGGSCNGGDQLKAYEFIHNYGISDDSCTPYAGLNWLYGFVVAGLTEVDDVQGAQCYTCNWIGSCEFVPK